MATNIRFTGSVDRRFAWLGNDAQGLVDLEPALIAFIGSATTSIAVSTMTFSLTGVGDALAAAAQAGRKVRIVGNAGHRFQPGFFQSQRGPVQLADNNLPALVARISFQSAGAPAVPGFAVDSGLTFGPRPNGMTYGWDIDVSGQINAHSAPAAFTSSLLRECYARRNDAPPRTWSINLTPGFYYVVAVTGEANFGSKSFVLAQGQTIFTFKNATGLHYTDRTNTGPGEFACSIADGGHDDESLEPQGRRLDVNSGTLALTVGVATDVATFTSLDYLEIYRASPTNPEGDPFTDRTFVQQRQLHHTKFILLDAETASPQLWTGSHNLTPVTPIGARSEDMVTTDDPAICGAFLQEFERWWGGSAATPNAANSFFGRFKTPAIAPSGTMPSTLIPGASFPWRVCFSPSASGLDMYQVAADHLRSATKDLLFLLEQLTDSGDFGALHGTTFLMNNVLNPQVSSGLRLTGLFGNGDATDSIFTRYAGDPDVHIAQSPTTHDKMVLADALRDTRQSRLGKLLCGSMNWSQGAFHINDEQTLVLHDPALANKALQRAMAGFRDAMLTTPQPADIVIVIDRSFSMTQTIPGGMTRMAAARTAASTFLDLLEDNGTHRVALVRFGVTVEPFAPPEVLTPLTAMSRATLHARISATDATLPIGNATCYGLALQEAQNLLTTAPAPHPRRIVVFLTDGEENAAPFADGIYQPLATVTGAEIHTTAFGAFDPFSTTGSNAILNDMATLSGGTFAQVDSDAVHLQKRFAEVARDAMNLATIIDPTFEVGGRTPQHCRVPLDLSEGIVQFCAFWGEATASVTASVRTPWGQLLTTRNAGVTHIVGPGRDLWRVDLARLAKAAKRSPIGTWTVELKASHPKAAPVRVDVAVYASRGGGGVDLRVEVERDANGVRILARALDGQEVAREVRFEAIVSPPPTSKRRKPRAIRLKPVKSEDPAWEGVVEARWPIDEEGVHAVRVVATGKSRAGEFQREQTLSWVEAPSKPRDRKPEPEPEPGIITRAAGGTRRSPR